MKKYLKKIFDNGAIFWEKAQCVCTVVKNHVKRPFPLLATLQYDVAIEQCENVLSLLFKHPSIYQGAIFQNGYSRLDDTRHQSCTYLLNNLNHPLYKCIDYV